MTAGFAEQLAEALGSGQRVAAFTGAGMSTESGLPDFRSAQGLWKGRNPMEFASLKALHNNYGEFAEFYRGRLAGLEGVLPNRGHKALARWEALGLVQSVATQNVDGLHQAAGSRVVHELHGRFLPMRCHACGAEAEVEDFRAERPCAACGGRLRPGVVLFGEMLPMEALSAAERAARGCDAMLVLGSSLHVMPAAGIPLAAAEAGAKVLLVNRDPTPLDDLADAISREPIGAVLGAVDELIGGD